MRILIGLSAVALLAACGGNKAANNNVANGATTNMAAPAPAEMPASNATANMAAGGSPITPRPVLVGVDPELDKCPSTGRSNPTRPIVVRTAPDAAAGEADTIDRVTNIAICDQDDRTNPQAGWYAIVYPATGSELGGCNLAAVPAAAGGTAYTGPCKSGWVRSTDIEVIAG